MSFRQPLIAATHKGIATAVPVVTSLSFITNTSVDGASVSTPTTFSGVSVGAEDPNRYTIVVGHLFSNTSNIKINGITVGGVAATEVENRWSTGTGCGVGIWIVQNPTGTNQDIVLSVSGNAESRGIGVYRLISSTGTVVGSGGNQATFTGSLSTSSFTTANGGVVVAGSTAVNAGGGGTAWTNATEKYDMDMRSQEFASSAWNLSPSNPLTVTSSQARAIAAACFL